MDKSLVTRIYAFTNQKGGVGKTTTVVNVAATMAEWGYRALVVDVDPQSNATTSLGINGRALSTSIYDVLSGEYEVADAICKTSWPGLDVLPSTPALAGAAVELSRLPNQEPVTRLAQILSPITDYDYLLLDSPPSLGILTVNVLTTSHGVVIPVQCEYLALEGLVQLKDTIERIQSRLNPQLVGRGIVLTMFDRRTSLSQQVADNVRQNAWMPVFDAMIPRSVRLSEAPSYGEPGVIYAPRSSGAVAYRQLTWELLRGDGHTPDWSPPSTETED